MDEIPEEIRPEIAIPDEFRAGTAFADAPREVAICAFPILAPIPFRTSFSDNHASLEEFVENMASISATHKSWAKLIIDTIEQQETDELQYTKKLCPPKTHELVPSVPPQREFVPF